MDAQDVNSSEQSGGFGDLAGGASDKGPTRSENQDAFWIPEAETSTEMGVLYLVADGVGGQESGADAAKLAVQAARQTFFESRLKGEVVRDALKEALQRANQAVYEEAQRRGVRRMGATFVAAVEDQNQLTIAHVGDARAYLVRQGEMHRLTRDDTWVQRQVEQGWITEEQAAKHEYRNVVTQVLGNKPEVNVHLSQAHALQQDDVVLLCSDGLYDALSDSQMLPILTGNAPQSAAHQLVQAAIKAEATDNITAVVVRAKPAAPTAAEPALPLAMVMADEPTLTPQAMADEPTLVPPPTPVASAPPPPADKKGRVSKWLILLAIVAVILIIATPVAFWLGSQKTASDTVVTETPPPTEAILPTEEIPALGPLDAASTIQAQTATEQSEAPSIEPTATPTIRPPDTATPLPTLTPVITPEPRGCVNNGPNPFIWDENQVSGDNCDRTLVGINVGDEVRILSEQSLFGAGSCGGVFFINIQSVADPVKEGWMKEELIDLLPQGDSCNP